MGNAFTEFGLLDRVGASLANAVWLEVTSSAPIGGGEQPIFPGPGDAPPVPEQFQQHGTEHGFAILGAFALADANHHAGAVDVGGAEGNGFGDAEPGAVAKHEHGAVARAGHVQEELEHLVGADHRREDDRHFGARELAAGPLLAERDGIEKLSGGGETIGALGAQALLSKQVGLVFDDMVRPELVGRSVEELCIPGEIMDITTLSLVGEVARLHVEKHASA